MTEMPVTPTTLRPWYLRLAWLALLIIGVAIYLAVLQTMIDTQNLNFFPTLLFIGSATVPLSMLVLAAGGSRFPVVDTTIVVFTAVAGGLIGTLVAGLLEYDTLRKLSNLPMIFVAVIEESAKLIVPVVLLLVFACRVRDPRAGLIIGVASGMGFAVLETMGYGFNALLSSRSIAAVDTTLLLRALLSPAGHIAWTGLICAALWHWRFGEHHGRGLIGTAIAFVGAVGLHALWDGSSSLAIHIGVVVISVGLLVWFIHSSHRAPRPAK